MSLYRFIKDLANHISDKVLSTPVHTQSTKTSDSLIENEHDQENTTVSILRSLYCTL